MQNPQPGPPTARPVRVAAGELALVAAVGLAAVWGGTRAGVGLAATLVVTLAAAAAALARLWGPPGRRRPAAGAVFADGRAHAEGAEGPRGGEGPGAAGDFGAWDAANDGDRDDPNGSAGFGAFDDPDARTQPGAHTGPDAHRDTAAAGASGALDARNGFAGIARRLQAAVNQQLTSLRDMQTRHGAEPDMFADLLHLDHGVSLIGRLADSLAVLGGVRQGRQWDEPVPLMGVVRGAMSRIVDYRRVDVDGLTEGLATVPDTVGELFAEPAAAGLAVRAEVVEPVVHALAELLDNATRYSPPDTRVAVAAHRIGDGLVVTVADAGVGLTPTVLRQAALALTASENALMRSPGTPRLGLTVVGRLAAANDFQVTLEPGAGGGATARIYLPGSLLTTAADGAADRAEPSPDTTARPLRRRSAAAPEPPSFGVGGLPQRRRWNPAAEEPQPAANGSAQYHSQDPYDQAGLWLGAFRAGEDGQRS